MRLVVFSTKPYDQAFLSAANSGTGGGPAHDLVFLDARLSRDTAALAANAPAICIFVNDVADAEVIARIAAGGTSLIALRCAGFNNVDLPAAAAAGITVVRVPAYSPHAVAEHTLALILSLNRKVHRAYARVREGNFALEGLLGFDLHGRTAGVIGTGKIGALVANILRGFGCRVLATDQIVNSTCVAAGVEYVALDELLAESHLVTLHCPLTSATHHLLNAAAFARMRPGAMVINTSRGALLDASAAIDALKDGRLGSLGLDVYEEEADMFFEDQSNRVLRDDVFARLLTFPNVLITGHQGFFTQDALEAIAQTTIGSLTAFERGLPLGPVVVVAP